MKKPYIAVIICIIILSMIIVFGNLFLVKSVEVVFQKESESISNDSIITASKVELNTNIFSLNEEKIANNITNHYDNNVITVQDIERVFPNKVKIYVMERKPILIIPYANTDDECVPTDINFQMTSRQQKSEINYKAIQIKGISVENTFNQSNFRNIREILNAFIDMNFTESSIVAFIKEIKVSDNMFEAVLRNGDCVFELDSNSDTTLYEQTQRAYDTFSELPYNSRQAFVINNSSIK